MNTIQTYLKENYGGRIIEDQSNDKQTLLKFRNGLGALVIHGKGEGDAKVFGKVFKNANNPNIGTPYGENKECMTEFRLFMYFNTISGGYNEFNPCKHENVTSWNHGYHSRCLTCGEEDPVPERWKKK